MKITKHKGGEVEIRIIAIAMVDGRYVQNCDELTNLLTANGTLNRYSGIIDWQYIQPTKWPVALDDFWTPWLTTLVSEPEVDEGDIFNIEPIEALQDCCFQIQRSRE